ncbi:hypothetical protein QM467_08770 [Rhodoblastus sp. 17X3]|uniref:hypothetical protein n=1 Tax=Rhodoblastus sp. 17X3 TaxID=3047026 RepID=UPI0024B7FC27|nr:hypothetical protein [Rhodoblastus sp. 17X3]MDI9848141.1 hypothetical protein [Rhodoblastus sp. 17X3]
MNPVETLIIDWLKDRNPIQRTISKTAAGKQLVVSEADLSGGQAALVALLDSDAPISREIRNALASALEPIGSSLLQLVKRPSRAPGRPSKSDTVRGAVREVYDAYSLPAELDRLASKKPIPAAGEKRKKVTNSDLAQSEGVSGSTIDRRKRKLKDMKNNKK